MDANIDVYEPCNIEASYFFKIRVDTRGAINDFELGSVASGEEEPSTDRAACFLRNELSLCSFGRLKMSKFPAEMD